MTVGSCLSIEVCKQLCLIDNSFTRISSVQHNRIDQLVLTYLEKQYNPIFSGDHSFSVKPEYTFTNVLENQFFDLSFGKSLAAENEVLMNFSESLNRKADLLIIDNFPDLYFKIYRNQEKNQLMFINKFYLNNVPKGFEFINDFISVETAIEFYKKLFYSYLRNHPNGLIVFLPFPANLSPKYFFQDRSKDFAKQINKAFSNYKQIYCLDTGDVSSDDLSRKEDIHHFTQKKYMGYAQDVLKIVALQG